MSVIIVASQEARAGRSTIAAALAYRFARDGRRVSLARLEGDDSAPYDAAAFAALDPPLSGGKAIAANDVTALVAVGGVVIEAPPGSVDALVSSTGGRVVIVGDVAHADVGAPADAIAGRIVIGSAADGDDVLAALPEDRVLAAPSAQEIAGALKARWLVKGDTQRSIARVMIGTVASDAASPYFAARESKCVVTRFDKTDIQLAALLTDLELLVLTGGGEPSPYLLDRVSSERNGVSVLLAEEDTVDAMRAIEGLYMCSRFAGQAKLDRAVELLDAAAIAIDG